MMLYIFPYSIIRYLLSRCSIIIPLFSKRAAPKLFLGFINHLVCPFRHTQLFYSKLTHSSSLVELTLQDIVEEKVLSRFSSPAGGRSIQAHFS
jgi:hypothetical protein